MVPGNEVVNKEKQIFEIEKIQVHNYAFDTSWPIEKRVFSPPCKAVSWSPTGNCFPSRSTKPIGTEMAGIPVRFAGTVNISRRYIESGSLFSPMRTAGVGVVGVAIASTDRKALLKSSVIRRRTSFAFP